jgi:hypothetical protein
MGGDEGKGVRGERLFEEFTIYDIRNNFTKI